ncbi:MAG: hypothetical protein ACM3KE_10810 [Hyphomicrobiales bacterium]
MSQLRQLGGEPDYIKRKWLAEQLVNACIDLGHGKNADKEHAEHELWKAAENIIMLLRTAQTDFSTLFGIIHFHHAIAKGEAEK